MTWVITKLCQDCLDESCVEVCPVDCIYVREHVTTTDNWTWSALVIAEAYRKVG